jgi:hypothetical protein
MGKRTTDEKNIIKMFSYMRPSGSITEQMFVDVYLTPLGFQRDQFGNLVVTVGDAPNILWSSHVDTVHHDEGIQSLHYDGEFLELSRHAKANGSNCLGADDTAGIWMMTEMVKAGVPGVYVIHDAEESGCIGSGKLAKGNPDFFKGIDAAIAFDRMGYKSVVTHQMGRRTASDAFANSFALAISEAAGFDSEYAPDDGGVYTDTNEYSSLVPECTNISVGYFSQHGRSESQNVRFLIALRDLLVKADFSKLVIERDPSVVESRYGGFGYGFHRGSYGDDDLYDPWDDPNSYIRSPENRSGDSMEELVKLYPEVAAAVLNAYGVTRSNFLDEISDVYGSPAASAF